MSIYKNLSHDERKQILWQKLAETCRKNREYNDFLNGKNEFEGA